MTLIIFVIITCIYVMLLFFWYYVIRFSWLTLDYSTEEDLGFLGHDSWFCSRSGDQSAVTHMQLFALCALEWVWTRSMSFVDLLRRTRLFGLMFMFIISPLPYCTRGHSVAHARYGSCQIHPAHLRVAPPFPPLSALQTDNSAFIWGE